VNQQDGGGHGEGRLKDKKGRREKGVPLLGFPVRGVGGFSNERFGGETMTGLRRSCFSFNFFIIVEFIIIHL
jgi:hypothetical protein